ncbi:DegT/DnrJ/EryC1/StrS family aminotransferase [Polynucleobacter paneuropaeus]|nr:DegT/DnrJ/EryC1/StrS family aminotransferase [Polynucleobacter paneuropaeus]
MSIQNKIPVHEPEFGEEEIAAVVAALRRGEISGSFGSAIPEFEEKFANYCGCAYGVAVTSGSTALHLAVQALGIGRGDEILVSASTNIATALAAYHNNAVAVPVDSEAITWNMNTDLLEGLITPNTKAIIPVHLFGHPCDMNKIMAVAQKYGLAVIEDCAESHGATIGGKMTGSFGDMGCFSFYANKIITTGEGGMVVTNNAELANKLRLLRNLAFQTPRFYHKVAGNNFRMTGYQASFGLAQLKKIDTILALKRFVANEYQNALKSIPGLQLPVELGGCRNVYWMYAIVVRPEFGMTRNDLMEYLQLNGVDTRTFFCPMNQQPFLQEQEGYRQIACPVADSIWETGLYLPSSNSLSSGSIQYISDVIKSAHGKPH